MSRCKHCSRAPGPSLSQHQLSLWKLAGQILPSSQTPHNWGMASRYSYGNVDASGSDTEQEKWKAQGTSGGAHFKPKFLL